MGTDIGIRCNVVAHGYIITSIPPEFEIDRIGNIYTDDVIDHRRHLLEEMAEVIVFLLSDKSKCVNGQFISCDDGDVLR